jgi:hypothetical protein
LNVIKLCHNKFTCHFDYENIPKKKVHNFDVDSYETRFSNTCDKLPISCNPHEDQVLSTWVVLAQKHASFIFCIVEVILYDVWMLSESVTQLCLSRDSIEDWPVGLDPS